MNAILILTYFKIIPMCLCCDGMKVLFMLLEFCNPEDEVFFKITPTIILYHKKSIKPFSRLLRTCTKLKVAILLHLSKTLELCSINGFVFNFVVQPHRVPGNREKIPGCSWSCITI